MIFKSLADLAGFAIKYFLERKKELKIEPKKLPKIWKEKGACFVTLYTCSRGVRGITPRGCYGLRGCMGTVLAGQPLYLDVVKNAIGAAFADRRFEPLKREELEDLKIEVSVLTEPRELQYATGSELIDYLYKEKPGVMIEYLEKRAVFIPKVWQEVRKAEDFLSHLCLKAGLPADFWRVKRLTVWVFFSTCLSDPDPPAGGERRRI